MNYKIKIAIAVAAVIVVIGLAVLLLFRDSDDDFWDDVKVTEEQEEQLDLNDVIIAGDGYSTVDFALTAESEYKNVNAKHSKYKALSSDTRIPVFKVPDDFPAYMGLVVDTIVEDRNVIAEIMPDTSSVSYDVDANVKYAFRIRLDDTSEWYIFETLGEAWASVVRETVE